MNSIAYLRLPEGIHQGVPEAAYHGDPAAEPSASSGILRLLTYRSAAHAREAHPRLNPAFKPDGGTEAKDRGTILHALTLNTPHPHRVIHHADYRKPDARAERDQAIADGLIPVKVADMEELQDVAASIRARLIALPEVWTAMQNAITNRMNEVTMIWRERGVLCRCRYDTLPDAKFGVTYDPKFTSLSAEPDAFGKKVTGDYSFQANLYPRAVKALRGDSPLFVFVAAETEAPYGVSLHALDPEAADLARQKVDAAIDHWAHCLQTGEWPGYAPLIHYHGAKPYEVAAWAERQGQQQQVRSYTKRPSQAAIDNYNSLMMNGARA